MSIEIPDNIPNSYYTTGYLKPEDVVMTIKCEGDILIIRKDLTNLYTKGGKLLKNWMEGMKEKHCSG